MRIESQKFNGVCECGENHKMTTRYCAHKLGIPFISMPTAASVDEFCSTVSAMTWRGCKKTMPGVAPDLVIPMVYMGKRLESEKLSPFLKSIFRCGNFSPGVV